MIYKKDDESNIEYIMRLAEGKINNLYDIDYSEFFKLAFGVDISSDEARKRFYGLKMILPYLEDETYKNISDDEILKKIEDKKIELQKEKYKFYDQRNAFNKKLRDEARLDEIKDLIIKTINENKLPAFNYKHNQIKKSDNDLLIFLNDIHYGLEIHNYFNDYSPEIFINRLKQYLDKIIQVKQLHQSENCYVFIGGDIISGHIHPQIQFSNTENTIQQIQGVSECLCNFINELHSYFNFVCINIVPGNHSRLEKNKRDALKEERLDLLIPWYMKGRLQNLKNVFFIDNQIDSTISILTIRNKIYYGIHGDYDSPKTAVNNLSLMLGYKPYGILMAHLHHNSIDNIQGVKVIMSGSFLGMDDYCIEKRLIGKPAQIICVCDKDGIDCFYDIEFT